MESNLATYLNFSILVQCLFSIVYLGTYQWRRNKWLVLIYIIIFSVQLGIFIAGDNLSFWQKLLIGNPGVILWVSPSFYLFTRELISVKTDRKSILMHLLPGLIFYVVFLFAKVSHPQDFIVLVSKGEFMFWHTIHLVVLLLTTIFYGYAILKLTKYNQEKYKNEYAESSIYITLDWLKYTVWTFLILTFLAVLSISLSKFFPDISIPFEVIEIFFLLAVMTLSYFAFRQPTLYQLIEEEEKVPFINPVIIEKSTPPKSLLSEEKIGAISKKIDTYFLEKQPYLQLDIRLPDIANVLDISSNELSWYLNEHHQMNFFTFINQYRIQHSVELLKDENYKHYTLEAISKMAGFRSKTTFNNRFKEIMKETPSAFRKKVGR